ncbi:GNAT family N-acetyltransferase [Ancylobacter terrae]|uniref:GNAT family N-acetyltransferase n=1 Tax=Ancylobacter sp. sgz301288 TaxID=3342077 RepID=UPI00385BCCBE
MPDAATIRPLAPDEPTIAALSSLLIETVAGGGSVGFMHPLDAGKAAAFCRAALEGAARGERIILGAFRGETLAGTVTLQLALPENQPHRAEIAKMMTRPPFRGRGIASALLAEAERLAIARGRTLLVLDTASEEGASGLYEQHGFVFAGEIPGFALKPHGGLTGTRLYFKRLAPA